MTNFGISSALLAIVLPATLASGATLSQVANIPTTDVLLARGNEAGSGTGASQATFGYRNNLAQDPAGSEGTRGRGQSFVINSTAGATYEISNLSIALAGGAGTGIRPDGDLIFTVFEYTGVGATAANQANDTSDWATKLGGTSGTQLFSESFEIAAGTSFLNSNLLNISFAAGELQLNDDTAYGFFLQYTLDGVAGLTGDVTIAFDADNDTNPATNPAGLLLSTNPSTGGTGTGSNAVSATRDLNYFITGAVVPEPSSLALLGLGSLALLRRRRK